MPESSEQPGGAPTGGEPTPRTIVRVVDVYAYRQDAQEPQFLLLRRAAERMYAGEWRMVAGKIEQGEQVWQAAVRELWEETGKQPVRLWTVPSVNAFYEWTRDQVNIIPVFAAELDGDPILDDEHDAFEWLSEGAALERLQWPEQRRLISVVCDMLKKGIPTALEISVSGSPSGRRA